MSHCKLITTWPIHFKLHTDIGIDSNSCTINMNWNIYTIFIQLKTIFFEKSVKTINSNNSTKFEVNWWRGSQFVCRAVNWELLGQFTSNFAHLLELIVLRSVYFLVKFRFFIPELWDFIHPWYSWINSCTKSAWYARRQHSYNICRLSFP
jgi:hypothetical protein